MSRDHYKGIPKKRMALLNADGDVEALSAKADLKVVYGTVSLSGGGAVVSGTSFSADSFVIATPQHNGPVDVNWDAADGYITISGTGDGLVAYQVVV